MRYTDPSGHRRTQCGAEGEECVGTPPHEVQLGNQAVYAWPEESVAYARAHVHKNTAVDYAVFVAGSAVILAAPELAAVAPDAVGAGSVAVRSGVGWAIETAAGYLCADGDCGNEVQSVWKLRPWERGRVIEGTLGRSPELAENFPVIDRFENGVATSIKSIDLNAATYQDTTRLAHTVTRYINTLAEWNGQTEPWRGFRVAPTEVQVKVLELAIPPGASPSQWRTLLQLQRAASESGVRLDIVIFH